MIGCVTSVWFTRRNNVMFSQKIWLWQKEYTRMQVDANTHCTLTAFVSLYFLTEYTANKVTKYYYVGLRLIFGWTWYVYNDVLLISKGLYAIFVILHTEMVH